MQRPITSFFAPKRARGGDSSGQLTDNVGVRLSLNSEADLNTNDSASFLEPESASQVGQSGSAIGIAASLDDDSASNASVDSFSNSSLAEEPMIMEFSGVNNSNVNANDLGTKDSGPAQPNLAFPRSRHGSKHRARGFKSAWYKGRPWLEYSRLLNRAFCFACRNFTTARNGDQAFVTTGFKNWRKALERMGIHGKSTLHISAMDNWRHFKDKGSVIDQLENQSGDEAARNREYLKEIIDALLFLAKEEISIR